MYERRPKMLERLLSQINDFQEETWWGIFGIAVVFALVSVVTLFVVTNTMKYNTCLNKGESHVVCKNQ